MKNIIHSCENCGRCDEDCPVCMEVKQFVNNNKEGCIFWTEDTSDLGITLDDKLRVIAEISAESR